MKNLLLISTCVFAILGQHQAQAAPCAAAPPGVPLPTPDWYNVLILVDVTGSMSDAHATVPTPVTKLQVALDQAKRHVMEMQTVAGAKPLNLALWAFDSTFAAPSFVRKIINFADFKSATAVLRELGFDAFGNPTPATRNPVFTPTGSTPLAAAACSVVSEIAANFNAANNVIPPGGFQWGEMFGGRLANIQRRVYIESDGLENSTPSTNECQGVTDTTSTDYLCYSSDSWQYKLRNKLQTGNALNPVLSTSKTGLIFNVDYIFTSAITGALIDPEAQAHASALTQSTPPTLSQANTLFGGITKMTGGSYRTVTVSANGTISARRPGDVNRNGCVDDSDYNQLVQFYGLACAGQQACIDADLNGDNLVDFSDYLILVGNFGAGCSAAP